MHRIRLALAVLAALSASACATTVSGETETLVLTSDPPGANVEVEPGWFEVTTPTSLEVERRDGPFRLTFRMDGYAPYRTLVRASTNEWVLGNLIFLPFATWGLQIDRISGADTALEPTAVHAVLVEEQ